MAPRKRPTPRLYTPIEEFGRRCDALSVAELERVQDTILKAVATGDELEDWYKRRDLAKRVCEALLSVVASIENQVDRRMAQVVLATEREFCGLDVGQRVAMSQHTGASSPPASSRNGVDLSSSTWRRGWRKPSRRRPPLSQSVNPRCTKMCKKQRRVP